ncbi:MAG TPA: hypothetical protein VHE23_00285 [Candidatus Acidoferrales bacterium]|nr:hypothetical protein [Candidatus Acidoferrales bacterium]
MPSDAKAPRINNRCACIVDRDALALAAVISSYLFEPASYLPLFLFPRVEVSKTDEAKLLSEGYVANLMGDQAGGFIGNALARIRECEFLILAGLNEHQKSFLILPAGLKTIEIRTLSDIHLKLSPLGLPAKGELSCKTSDVLQGLYIAQKREKRLVIDEGALALPEVVELQKGIVVIENLPESSAVVAINYANSIGASVLIVDALAKHEGRSIQRWIQDWKENNDPAQLQKLKDAVSRRLGSISFIQFDYATFFTEGLPYSLILENVIPCGYVHLLLRPDLFVFNSIMFENGENFHTAVVFSPVFFQDEETSWLCEFFSRNKYYSRALIGGEATLANLDFHAQYFPFDLLHICSHGGEVDGYEMSEQFADRDGNSHVVEFDEVVGFTPVPDKLGMVAVHRKVFPRKLDGFSWMSAELEKENIPGHVCLDMWKCMLESRRRRKPKGRIAMSCAIACADSIHQGEFNALASYSSPLVFNNTCWSWYEVASFFLACGARGYIGTLWAIDNQAAVVAAQTFYENLFFESVLAAFHKAVKAIDPTVSKDIYVYWGLHFSTLSPGRSREESQGEVCKELVRAVEAWVRNIESTKNSEVKKNSVKVLKSILRELVTSFGSDSIRRLEMEVRKRVPELSQTDMPRGAEQPGLPASRSLMDHPIEYREIRAEDKAGT